MKRLEIRAIISLTLAALLLAGIVLFLINFAQHGKQWATFYGNQGIYDNGVLRGVKIYDRNGILLAESSDGQMLYNDDAGIRLATIHSVGDVNENIGTSAYSLYKDKLIGYNMLSGTYRAFGENVYLTLDANLCKRAYELISPYEAGSVGIYNYQTGEVVCMVSSPSIDPFESDELISEGAYINRFLSSTVTPGSVFKTVTAACAVESGIPIEEFSYDCSGTRDVNGEELNCFSIHGSVDMNGAMASSCNGAFSVITESIGADKLEQFVSKVGLTKAYKFDGITTARGDFEFPKDDEQRINLDWAGIGQYHDQMNPCSMMIFMGAVANGGNAAIPTVLTDGYGKLVRPSEMTGKILSDEASNRLSEMMKEAVVDSYGEYNFPGLDIYAKSGTAEVEGKLPNACFVGFIKNEGSPYAFVICLENAGEALYTASPIVSELMQLTLEL